MAKYVYRIFDSNTNTERSGEIEGESLDKVADLLLSQNYTILDLRVQGLDLEKLKNINVGGVPFDIKVNFIRQLSFMVSAGLPITQALEIAKNQALNVQFREILTKVLKDVQGGTPLSKAFDKQGDFFDLVVKNLIKAGEESGKLDIILERIADDLERKRDFNAKVQGAMIYPAVILIAIIIVFVALLVFMIPEMSKIYANSTAEMPLPTMVIVNVSNFLTQGYGGILVLVSLIAAVIGFFYYRGTPSGRLVTDKLALKIPIFGQILQKSEVASFARTFSMLITAGVPILDALKLVNASTTNMLFRLELDEARKKVEKGVPLSAPMMNSEAFPSLLGHMMKVGEETGKIDEVISRVGKQYASEVDLMADNLTKLMEPLIIIVMGVVVLILALAVYLPVFNLGSTISAG